MGILKSTGQAFVVCTALYGLSLNAQAQIYEWADASGKTHYTDKPLDDAVARRAVSVKKLETTTLKNTFSADEASIDVAAVKTVELYATAWCGYCKKARRYFAENNIAYTEYDIEKDTAANARHKAMGARGVPVVFVEGKRMNGFSEAGFERLYR